MSSYTVNNAQLIHNRLRTGFSTLLSQSETIISSTALFATCSGLAAGEPTAALQARWTAIDQLEGARQLLSSGAADHLAAAERWTVESQQAALTGNSQGAGLLASQASNALLKAATATVETLRQDERTAVAGATKRALAGMGYSVSEARGARSTGLWAERGHEIVAVLVQDGGAMEIDNAGLAGGACTASMKLLQHALHDEGVVALGAAARRSRRSRRWQPDPPRWSDRGHPTRGRAGRSARDRPGCERQRRAPEQYDGRPDHTQDRAEDSPVQSTDRSTTRLLADLDRADAASQVQILTGNTSDIVIDVDENPSRATASACQAGSTRRPRRQWSPRSGPARVS